VDLSESRLYYRDAYLAEFDARLVEQFRLGQAWGVVLDQTAFYPTSGGQPHDTGLLNGVIVTDVIEREEDKAIVHVVGQTLDGSLAHGQVDWARRFDLMHQINARGTFMVSKFAIPFLAKVANPHILMLSPPLDMKEKWFAPATAYAMAKFGMSLVVLGLAGEQRGKIAVNALWPRTTIATAAIKNLLGGDAIMRASRKPEILAEAAYRIFHKPKSFTGNFLIDDTFLASEGVSDFDQYRVDPSQPLQVDFFVPDDVPPPKGVSLTAKV